VLARCAALALAAAPLACSHAPERAPAAELRFSDFYVLPIGRMGQQPTETLLGLDGKRVAIRGYMVAEEEPFPGLFILAPLPVRLAERADGPADYLPPATVFVHLPASHRDELVRHLGSPLEVTGTLELGPREEQGDRVSYVRLQLADLESVQTIGRSN